MNSNAQQKLQIETDPSQILRSLIVYRSRYLGGSMSSLLGWKRASKKYVEVTGRKHPLGHADYTPESMA